MNKLTTQQVIEKFGNPGDGKNLAALTLPYPFYLDWALSQTTSKITCHKLIVEPLGKIFKEILEVYGIAKIHELGIDQFAGCFNLRPQRGYEKQYLADIEKGGDGSEYLSRHSWAIALDFDADRNKLNETSKTARFARPEYKTFIDIFYKHGFISYGREKNYDWMHFEFYKTAL